MSPTKKLSFANAMKQAHEEFTPALAQHGFIKLSRQHMYVRNLGNIYQVLSFFKSQWDDDLYVHAKIWLPAMLPADQGPGLTFVQAQEQGMELGGRVGRYSVGDGVSLAFGDIDSLSAAIVLIKRSIDDVILPWFNTFSSLSNIQHLIHDSTYEDDPEAQLLIDNMLASADAVDYGIEDVSSQFTIPDSLVAVNVADVLSCNNYQFRDFLLSHGFQYDAENEHRFTRMSGNTCWVVIPEVQSHGVHVGMHIYAWRSEVQDSELSSASDELPDMMMNMTGGMLGDQGLKLGRQSWLVNTEVALPSAIHEMCTAIECYAIDWFESASTDEGFIQAINPEFSEMNFEGSMYDLLVKKIRNK